nr:MAG TPA: hypothetical protein [Caudoviricetes sp.]
MSLHQLYAQLIYQPSPLCNHHPIHKEQEYLKP